VRERQTVDDLTVALPGEIRQAAIHTYFRNSPTKKHACHQHQKAGDLRVLHYSY